MKALSPEQIDNLDEEAKKAATYRLGILATKPAIRLIGDAYSELAKKAEDGLNAESSFGGGIEIESLTLKSATKATIAGPDAALGERR